MMFFKSVLTKSLSIPESGAIGSSKIFRCKSSNIALSGYRNYTAPPFVFSSDEFEVLKNLKNDNSIFIIKPDKRSGVVILNRDDYWSKMESILSDTNKFKPLNDDPIKTTFRRESTVRRFLRKLNKSKVISNELFSKLAPTGPRPGILYGLPKVHKPNIPLRPIVSSINSHSFNIAKFLVPLLRPISVSHAFSFLQELFEQKFNNNVVMASFDVTSLFTNMLWMKPLKLLRTNYFLIQTTLKVSHETDLLNF